MRANVGRTTVFETRGIGLEEIAWIQRDQFLYYVQMERQLSDPSDWPRFRQGLLAALAAAFGLDDSVRITDTAPEGIPQWHERMAELLDEVRSRHDPTMGWDRFVEELWEARAAVRPDLG